MSIHETARRACHALAFVAAWMLAAGLSTWLVWSPVGLGYAWLPGGILLGVLLRVPTAHWWRWLGLGFAAGTAFGVALGQGWTLALLFGASEALTGLFSAWLVRSWARGRPRLHITRDVLAFTVGGAGAGPLLGAALHLSALHVVRGSAPWAEAWMITWSSGSLGVLLGAGWILAVPLRWRVPERFVEALSLAIAFAAMGGLVMTGGYLWDQELMHLVLPLFAWAALRFGPRSVLCGGTLISGVFIAWIRWAPSRGTPTWNDPMLGMQLYTLSLTTCGLFLAALLAERQRVTRALREREQRFRHLYEDAPVAYQVINPDGLLDSVNPAWCSLFGLSREAALGRPFASWVHPADRGRWTAFLAGEPGVRHGEFLMQPAHGGVLVVQVDARIAGADEAHEACVQCILHDLTERRRVEAAARSSEAELAAIYEHAPSLMYLLDAQHRVIRANAAAMRFSTGSLRDVGGLAPGDLLGCSNAHEHPQGCGHGAPCGTCPLRRAILETTQTGRRVEGVEIRPAVAAGETQRGRVLVGSTALVQVEGKPRTLVCLEDVSARRHGEEEFQALVEHAPDGIVILTDGRFDYLNAAALRMLGAQRAEDLLGQPLTRCLPAERCEIWNLRLNGLIQHRQPVPALEDVISTLGGATLPIEVSAVPWWHKGKPSALAFVRDLSDRQRLERQLLQSQKMEAIGRLAGGVAHDFNNILAVVMMQVGLLQSTPSLDEPTRAGLDELEDAARRAADLTRQLLMFSRRSAAQLRPVDLNDIVAQLLKMLRRLLGEQVSIQFDPGATLPSIEADPGMIDQVVVNLAVNARDAMPDGGTLSLSTELVDLFPEDLAAHPEGGPGPHVVLKVSDVGVGMDAETLARAFEPFFTTKGPGRGTGLGLATVYGIVHQHGGWVEAESVVGKGTTFRIYFPARARREPPTRLHTRLSAPQGRGEMILLVEDESAVRKAIGQSLRQLGYRVLEAGNGPEALRVWERMGTEINLVLTDMVMPQGMTGLHLAQALQELRPGVKVIISSGYTADPGVLEGAASDRFAFLPKPYEPAELARVVSRALASD